MVASVRPERETDRTEAALTVLGVDLPLRHGGVQVRVSPAVAESIGAQRLLAMLVNLLARMKGAVSTIYVDVADVPRREGVPLDGVTVQDGLARLVSSLNDTASEHLAALRFGLADSPAASAWIDAVPHRELTLGSDGWRALAGEVVTAARFDTPTPFGAAMAAVLGASDLLRQLIAANGGDDLLRRPIRDLCFSTYDFGTGPDAASGPDEARLNLTGWAVPGVGAGGTAALYTLAMIPELTGIVDLIEPGRHKLSNLGRYLMTTAAQVHAGAHKLGTAADHLASFAPLLETRLHPLRWELLDAHPWTRIVSTVDTIEARWAIQRRSTPGAQILDAAVNGLLYSVLRVRAGGWCLECKHPYDPDLALKQRAARWAQPVATVEEWTANNVTISQEMVDALAGYHRRHPREFGGLVGMPFREAPAVTECGETALRLDVPSQAPILPIATSAAGALVAAEIAKAAWCPDAQLDNWLGHDLARAPARPRVATRMAKATCPNHR